MSEETERTTSGDERGNLPLVIELLPGQAREGLVTIFDSGDWEGRKTSNLIAEALGNEHDVEDRRLADRVETQLNSGGQLLYNGQSVGDNPAEYTVREQSASGQDYLYAAFSVIQPQEGGAYVSW